MMNLIQVPYGGVSKLSKKFGVSMKAVKNALRGKTKSELAFKIRQYALSKVIGGKEYKTIN